MKSYKVYTDGGARGNPGPAGCGVLVFGAEDELVDFTGKYINHATNNVAEYEALLLSFDLLSDNNIKEDVTFYMDSELIIKQIKGEYKVKDAKLKVYYAKIMDKLEVISDYEFVHVLRNKNKFADRIVNLVLDTAAND